MKVIGLIYFALITLAVCCSCNKEFQESKPKKMMYRVMAVGKDTSYTNIIYSYSLTKFHKIKIKE
jgi:hypothetical protein